LPFHSYGFEFTSNISSPIKEYIEDFQPFDYRLPFCSLLYSLFIFLNKLGIKKNKGISIMVASVAGNQINARITSNKFKQENLNIFFFILQSQL